MARFIGSSHIPHEDVFESKRSKRSKKIRTKEGLTKANHALFPEQTPQKLFDAVRIRQRAYYSDPHTKVFCGDVCETLTFLKQEKIKVDCIVTSPPFYGQRDYGHGQQIGLETHPSEYIDKLVTIFALCRDILRDTGSLWINIGDTYWSGKGQHRSKEAKQSARRFGVRPQDLKGDGQWCRPKQLLLIPHRLAIAMQAEGWLVRNDNVLVKPNPIPDQVRDRCSMSHEYVFHFTKERWYYFDRPSVAVESSSGKKLPPRDTWQVPPARGDGNHKAAFSEELVRIPILGSCPPKGIVLDPFAGTGTTLFFARRHGLRSIGIDLVKDYCQEMTIQLRQGDMRELLP